MILRLFLFNAFYNNILSTTREGPLPKRAKGYLRARDAWKPEKHRGKLALGDSAELFSQLFGIKLPHQVRLPLERERKLRVFLRVKIRPINYFKIQVWKIPNRNEPPFFFEGKFLREESAKFFLLKNNAVEDSFFRNCLAFSSLS